MQITTLLGSAKKKGNTATVLGWVEEELKSLEHDVERIYLHYLKETNNVKVNLKYRHDDIIQFYH